MHLWWVKLKYGVSEHNFGEDFWEMRVEPAFQWAASQKAERQSDIMLTTHRQILVNFNYAVMEQS